VLQSLPISCHLNITEWRKQIVKLLIMYLPLRYFLPLGSKYSFRYFVLKHNRWHFLRLRAQVPQLTTPSD
jgi:hypothetical protein